MRSTFSGNNAYRISTGLRLLFGRSRQQDSECGPLSHPALHLDIAAVILDEAVTYREAQSNALGAVGLGGEEGVEDLVEVFGLDAAAGIADLKPAGWCRCRVC